MFAGAQSFGYSGLYRCLDRACSVVGGNIDVDVGACVCETETDRDRLRERLAADLGDHFGLVNDSGVEKVIEMSLEILHRLSTTSLVNEFVNENPAVCQRRGWRCLCRRLDRHSLCSTVVSCRRGRMPNSMS